MLFYAKKIPIERKKEIRNIKSQVKLMKINELDHSKLKFGYLPNFWFEKCISLTSPGTIHTLHLLCKHGKMRPSYYDCFPPKNKFNTINQDSSYNVERSFLDLTNDESVYTIDNLEKQSVKLPIEILEYFIEKVMKLRIY